MHVIQQPRTNENLPVTSAKPYAVKSIQMFSKVVYDCTDYLSAVLLGFNHGFAIGPWAGQDRISEPFPLGPPVIFHAPGSEEDDFLILFPQFAKRCSC